MKPIIMLYVFVFVQGITFLLCLWVASDMMEHKLKFTSVSVLTLSELFITGGMVLGTFIIRSISPNGDTQVNPLDIPSG